MLAEFISLGEAFSGFYGKEPENIKHITTNTAILISYESACFFFLRACGILFCSLFRKQKLIFFAMGKYIKGLYAFERNAFLNDKYIPAQRFSY